jgi:tripartite-type tricarboxylate transporter receptor subunit TctC
MVGWFALMAPTGTPAEVIQRVHRDLQTVLANPEIAQRIQTIGPIPDGTLSVDQVRQFLQAEAKRWGEATQEIGILPE